jgi:ABC-2 type transport system permease protein
VLTQLRRDHRTAAMLLVLPCLLITLLWWMFKDSPVRFDRLGPALLAMFPFIVMFLVTSVTTLRERVSGTLERLLAMPMGKLDFLLGYAIAFGWSRPCSPRSPSRSRSGCSASTCRAGLAADRGRDRDAVLGSALGLFVSAFATTEFQAVQFMPAFVIPQILLCGLFIPASSCRRARAISNVLPLSLRRRRDADARPTSATGDVWQDLAVVTAFALGGLGLGRRPCVAYAVAHPVVA